jgi:hypothetical protein
LRGCRLGNGAQVTPYPRCGHELSLPTARIRLGATARLPTTIRGTFWKGRLGLSYRKVTMSTRPCCRDLFVPAVIIVSFMAGCAEPGCPDGYHKVRSSCRRDDAGTTELHDSAVEIGSAGDAAAGERDAAPGLDASTPVAIDAATSQDGGAIPFGPGFSADAASSTDAAFSSDAADDANTPSQPVGECDKSRPCSVGYTCIESKCVSACEQTKCDPNATCAISGGAAVCSCNGGYIAQGAGANPSCVRDVACTELNCATNAECKVGTDQLRHCVCKLGYTGTGTSCAPVSCSALTIQNGTVSGGTTYNDTATYRCDTGYELDLFVGNTTRKCGADKEWTGSAPKCNPVSCGAPPSVEHASVAPASAGTFGAQATYTCDTGYEPSASTMVRCGADKRWSAAPKCNLKCGNTRLDQPGEQCDPSVAGTDKWQCNSSCRFQTFYTACWSDSDCDGLAGERCVYNACTKGCTGDAACPTTPAGTSTTRYCETTIFKTCLARCSSASAACPDGLVCQSIAVESKAEVVACASCGFDEECPPGKRCFDAAGNPSDPLAGRLGRCR